MRRIIQYTPYLFDAVNTLSLFLRKENKSGEGEITKLQESVNDLYSGTLDVQKWIEAREKKSNRLQYWLSVLTFFSLTQTVLLFYLLFK